MLFHRPVSSIRSQPSVKAKRLNRELPAKVELLSSKSIKEEYLRRVLEEFY